MDPELRQWLQVITPALIPTLAVLIAMLQNRVGLDGVSKRIDDLSKRIDDVNRRIDDVNRRIDDSNGRINELKSDMNKRFDANEAIWRAELHRVEEVLDARLRHLEESR
jgi:peptidoglycan hydrolase CwlO-like protein